LRGGRGEDDFLDTKLHVLHCELGRNLVVLGEEEAAKIVVITGHHADVANGVTARKTSASDDAAVSALGDVSRLQLARILQRRLLLRAGSAEIGASEGRSGEKGGKKVEHVQVNELKKLF
jgi:hypothetical protein